MTTTGAPPVRNHAYPLPTDCLVSLSAFGDPDDHLRLCAILAQTLKKHFGVSMAGIYADVCLDPAASWGAKLEALTTAFQDLPLQKLEQPIALIDIDALFTGVLEMGTRWDDNSFRVARSELLQVLVAATRRGGLELLRPAPIEAVSDLIRQAELSIDDSSHGTVLDNPRNASLTGVVTPEIVPLVEWLLSRGILTSNTAEDLADEVREEYLTEHIVLAVYDALRPSARIAAKRLATVRPPQSANGHFGPFRIGSGVDPASIARVAVDQLIECGFVQRFASSQELYVVPRAVRSILASHAESLRDPVVRSEHARLASIEIDLSRVEDAIEIHHHAIAAGDVARSIETALFYISDLRRLAVALSMESKFTEAADVFAKVVSRDDKDAYAWEYLAYNRARSLGPRLKPEFAMPVVQAYEQAAKLEPQNPLFAGRWLGSRAEINEDVVSEFGAGLKQFYESFGETGVSYFAEPAIRGFIRANRSADLAGIRSEWKSLLYRSARLIALLDSIG